MKVILVVDRGGELLCREADKSAVPQVGDAFTIEDEGESSQFSSTVEATTSGPNGTPLVYGGAWPHDPEDTRLKRRGFRACRSAEQERIGAELAKGPA